MKVLCCILISAFLAVSQLLAQPTQKKLMDMSNAELLVELDKTLAQREFFKNQKKAKLNHLKNELASATDIEQRYWTARNLYNEYKTYDSDSALYYAELSLGLARKSNREKWIAEMNIFRSYIYSATGLLEEAKKSIDKVNADDLDGSLSLQYNEQLLFLYTHRDQYLGLVSKESPYTVTSMELLESFAQNLPKTDPQYCWFKGWYSLSDVNKSKEVIPDVFSVVKESKFESVNDAKNAWILSRLYEKVGDKENNLKFLILSAIVDVKTYNKEIASLEQVANIMYLRNDLKRANKYINYCLNCANEYKSRIRVGRLADLELRIATAYQHEIEEQSKNLRMYFIVLTTIVILLLCTLAFSFVQDRKLHKNKVALHDANAKLSLQIEKQKNLQEQLKVMNNRLVEANGKLKDMYSDVKQETIELYETNYAKERYIADIFAICSNYINILDDFRRNIYRMLMARRYDELKELTKNPELSNSEIKELYQNFDKVFLGIYPDFVKDFNTLLRPEEQIVLKKGEQLNTELRIYALVRLGLNDSTKIAQFLHCSVRTVYNTRQRIRNKAIISKEGFANAVKSLGKIAY